MLLAVAGTLFCGTLVGVVLLVGGPGWVALVLGFPGVVLTAIAGRHLLIQREKD
jgi:hypothetical protein